MKEPIQIVEVEQPVCGLTYGTAPCTAQIGVTGSRKCFNTRKTCQDRANYDAGPHRIVWRFTKPSEDLPDIYSRTAQETRAHPIPSLLSVSTVPTKINIGGGSEDMSPLGRRGSISIVLQDHPWDDSVEDKYLGERDYDPIRRGTFWSKFLARNPFHARWPVRVIDGYRGQALGEMQRRTYVLDRINGPDASGRVTITAKDPLGLADEKRTQFPRVSDITLDDALDDEQTSDIIVVAVESEITDDYGNTGSTRYLRIDDEIISYTGHTGSDSRWTLTGVGRGVLGTIAAEHEEDAKCQRVGRYDDMLVWELAKDLLLSHTLIDPAFLDEAQWDDEGQRYLSPFNLTGTVAEPTPVSTLLGELTEQCPFYMWWDERKQKILIRAVRPPLDDGVGQVDDESHIIAGSPVLREDPSQRLSRVFLYYRLKDPTRSLNDIGNYSSVRGRIDADAESESEHGEVRVRQIFSRWLITAAQAIHTTTRVLSRFRDQVRFLSVRLDAKDRDITTADVLEVTTRVVADDTGESLPTRWQVISVEEVAPGEVVRYDMQEFTFHGRVWIWAAEDAPDYDSATEQQREDNAYIADENGKVGNDDGYQWV